MGGGRKSPVAIQGMLSFDLQHEKPPFRPVRCINANTRLRPSPSAAAAWFGKYYELPFSGTPLRAPEQSLETCCGPRD